MELLNVDRTIKRKRSTKTFKESFQEAVTNFVEAENKLAFMHTFEAIRIKSGRRSVYCIKCNHTVKLDQ